MSTRTLIKRIFWLILIFLCSAVVAAVAVAYFKKEEPEPKPEPIPAETAPEEEPEEEPKQEEIKLPASAALGNCTMNYGNLMLINPVFTVTTDYIARRRLELIDLTDTYGIKEYKSSNGKPLLDSEAATHLSEMLTDYKNEHPGHEMGTRSCFRAQGTNCGRLCYKTGTSDHHTGLTCDLIDQSYGSKLDTSHYDKHPEWQWLHENSYKYGFIDRFISEWSGGPMSQPVNINEEGSTGLYETWHYRYVGVEAATKIRNGIYNNGRYDSLEHYLKASGKVVSLTGGTCEQRFALKEKM